MKSYFAKKIFPRNPPKSLTRETKLPQKNLYMPPDWDKGKRSGVCYAYLIYRSPERKGSGQRSAVQKVIHTLAFIALITWKNFKTSNQVVNFMAQSIPSVSIILLHLSRGVC